MKLLVNPDYKFKSDLDRVCLYSDRTPRHDSSTDWTSYIHPYQAAILMLFDGEKETEEIVAEISSHFNIPNENASKLIESYIENDSPVYTEWQGEKVTFPKNMLIDVEKAKAPFPKRKFPKLDVDFSNVNLANDRAHKAPHSILWMLTSKCVTNCAYCYADKKTPYTALSTERALEIVDQAHELGVRKIDVVGGEVFLRKDWDVIVGRIIEHGMMPTFISTKMPVTDEIVQKLKKTGYSDVIQISLDSMDEDILAKTINVRKGYLKELLDGIQRLDEAGFEIQIDTILTKDTATREGLEQLADYLQDIRHFKYWEIRVPDYTLYSAESFKEIKAPRQQLMEIEKYVDTELRKKFRHNIIFSQGSLYEKYRCASPDEPCFRGGLCGYLQTQMFVLPDGKVSVCEQVYWHPDFLIGDLKKNSIDEVWQSARAKLLHSNPKEIYRSKSHCTKCQSFDDCNSNRRRCIVQVMKAYGKNNWDYPDPRCIYAPRVDECVKY